MFQRFLYIFSDWLQTTASVYIFEATTFLLTKFKVCVSKCQVYFMLELEDSTCPCDSDAKEMYSSLKLNKFDSFEMASVQLLH